MATLQRRRSRHLGAWFHPEEHPAWMGHFTTAEQDHLLEDDLDAGHRVPGLLISILGTGLLLAIITVTLIW